MHHRSKPLGASMTSHQRTTGILLKVLTLLVSQMVVVGVGMGRPAYVSRVPTRYSCDTCHLDPENRNLRTGFGIDFALSRGVWANTVDENAGICRLDSDGDDLTNGQELGDPDCAWRPGQPLPGQPTTNPAEARDPDRCGDGLSQAGEACDGEDLDGLTCVSLGFMDGELVCGAHCILSSMACNPFPEPDGALIPDAEPVADAGLSVDVSRIEDHGLRRDGQMVFDVGNPVDATVPDAGTVGDTVTEVNFDQGFASIPDMGTGLAAIPQIVTRTSGCATTRHPQHSSVRPLGVLFILIWWRWVLLRPRGLQHRSRFAARP
jgi:hypothetical protein